MCEVLSPSTEGQDREIKMPIYARYGVANAWLIDPLARTLEAYALEAGAWRELARFAGGAQVTVAPFEAVSIGLDALWAPTKPGRTAISRPFLFVIVIVIVIVIVFDRDNDNDHDWES